MAKNKYKKPDIKQLEKVLKATGGNLTDSAAMLGCSRTILYRWIEEDGEFADAFREARKRIFDKALSTAQAVAFGVPVMENGKVMGWQEHPDPQMLRYFLSTLGRDEGFGEEVTVTHRAEKGIDINRWIELEMQIDKGGEAEKESEEND